MVVQKFVTFFVTRTGSEIAPEALMQQLVGVSTESASVYWYLLVICSLRPPRFETTHDMGHQSPLEQGAQASRVGTHVRELRQVDVNDTIDAAKCSHPSAPGTGGGQWVVKDDRDSKIGDETHWEGCRERPKELCQDGTWRGPVNKQMLGTRVRFPLRAPSILKYE